MIEGFLEAPAFGAARSLEDLEIASFRAGDRAGEYTITRPLAVGAMGVVYVATDAAGREVALKLLRGGANAARRARAFEREAEALARLDHPAIAAILGSAITREGIPTIAMELVRGRPLDRYLANSGADPGAKLRLFCDIVRGVAHAHARGVVHRDLKPSNILVIEDAGGEARAKILDFGLAKLESNPTFEAATRSGATRSGATRSGELVGTLAAMAPEQALGRAEDVGPATDVYALGAILYSILAGRPPVEVGGLPLYEAVAAICQRSPRRPRGAAADSWRIARMALEKDPRDRYPSAGEMLADLERHLAGARVAARRPPLARRLRRALVRDRWGLGLLAFAAAAAASLWGAIAALERRTLAAETAYAREAAAARELRAKLAARPAPNPNDPRPLFAAAIPVMVSDAVIAVPFEGAMPTFTITIDPRTLIPSIGVAAPRAK